MTELKPCPFCGGKARVICNPFAEGDAYFITCVECDMLTGNFDSEALVIEAWNARAEKTCHLISRYNASAFWFECTECGGNSLHRYKYCPHCGAKVNGVEN